MRWFEVLIFQILLMRVVLPARSPSPLEGLNWFFVFSFFVSLPSGDSYFSEVVFSSIFWAFFHACPFLSSTPCTGKCL